MYKILNGVIDCPELLQKIGLKVPSFNSRINPPFAIPYSKNYYFTIILLSGVPPTNWQLHVT